MSSRGDRGSRSTILLAADGFSTVSFSEEQALENAMRARRIAAADNILLFKLYLPLRVPDAQVVGSGVPISWFPKKEIFYFGKCPIRFGRLLTFVIFNEEHITANPVGIDTVLY